MIFKKQPTISIVVPVHDMKGAPAFLWRLVNSLLDQTFQDYEIIITKSGKMAENTNAGIRRAKGEFVKVLYLDDYLTSPNALEVMLMAIGDKDWLIAGAHNNLTPIYTNDIEKGNNKLGSPSALMFRNHKDNLYFDEKMSWLLDCDLYKRMENRYGQPVILNGNWITLGEGDHQMTNLLTNEEKLAEHEYITKKYEG